MTRIWRCVHKKYLEDAYRGLGGPHASGRWNSQGRPIIYASHNAATAAMEALVKVNDLTLLTTNFVLIGATIPEELISEATAIPVDWNDIPAKQSTQQLGDKWLHDQASLALSVPSAIVPDTNVLINPRHPKFNELKVDDAPFQWNPRLVES